MRKLSVTGSHLPFCALFERKKVGWFLIPLLSCWSGTDRPWTSSCRTLRDIYGFFLAYLEVVAVSFRSFLVFAQSPTWCASVSWTMPWYPSATLRSVATGRCSSAQPQGWSSSFWLWWWSMVRNVAVRLRHVWGPQLISLYVLTCWCRLHRRVWGYRWPPSRKDCCAPQRTSEQGIVSDLLVLSYVSCYGLCV